MRHFLTRRWITIHLMTLVIIAVCLSMAFWQLGRLQDRRAENDLLVAQSVLPASELTRLLPSAGAGATAIEDAGFRHTRTTGTYDPAEQVVLQSRSLKGRQGNHLLTPLILDSGEAVLVDRGWVPLPTTDEVLADARTPTGRVTVDGVLLPSERKGFLGVSDPPPGNVEATPRVDLDRLADQLPYELYPLYIRLQSQEPANADLPRPVPIPAPDEGPHMEYLVQWLLFAVTAVVIYLGLIRRDISRRRIEEADPAEPEPAPSQS